MSYWIFSPLMPLIAILQLWIAISYWITMIAMDSCLVMLLGPFSSATNLSLTQHFAALSQPGLFAKPTGPNPQHCCFSSQYLYGSHDSDQPSITAPSILPLVAFLRSAHCPCPDQARGNEITGGYWWPWIASWQTKGRMGDLAMVNWPVVHSAGSPHFQWLVVCFRVPIALNHLWLSNAFFLFSFPTPSGWLLTNKLTNGRVNKPTYQSSKQPANQPTRLPAQLQ